MNNYSDIISTLYIGYLGRAPDPEGYNYWMTALENGLSKDQMAKIFASEPESTSLYSVQENDEPKDSRSLLNNMFLNIFGRDGDTDGLDFWVAALDERGLSFEEILFELTSAAQGSDIQAIENKAAVVTQFLDMARADPFFEMTPEIIEITRSSLKLVTADVETVELAVAELAVAELALAEPVELAVAEPVELAVAEPVGLAAAEAAELAAAEAAELAAAEAAELAAAEAAELAAAEAAELAAAEAAELAAAEAVTAVYNDTIDGTPGVDTITFTSSNTKVNAGEGANTIKGTSGDNLIIAGDGIDTITVTSGNNTIEAGGGANTITATKGNNTITSGIGADTITVTSGNNTIEAGDGANTITATEGNNTITSGIGADTITVTSGNNTIEAGDGANTIVATSGVNTINTGVGADNIKTGGLAGRGNSINAGDGDNIINTGAGDDTVTSGNNADTINTGGGDDVINAGGGNDKMTGGTGSDDFIFKDGFGTDVIYDFDVSNVDEYIDLSAVTGITNYTDLKTNHLRSNSTNEAEIFDEANTITLAGVSTADLSDTDFIF